MSRTIRRKKFTFRRSNIHPLKWEDSSLIPRTLREIDKEVQSMNTLWSRDWGMFRHCRGLKEESKVLSRRFAAKEIQRYRKYAEDDVFSDNTKYLYMLQWVYD